MSGRIPADGWPGEDMGYTPDEVDPDAERDRWLDDVEDDDA